MQLGLAQSAQKTIVWLHMVWFLRSLQASVMAADLERLCDEAQQLTLTPEAVEEFCQEHDIVLVESSQMQVGCYACCVLLLVSYGRVLGIGMVRCIEVLTVKVLQ